MSDKPRLSFHLDAHARFNAQAEALVAGLDKAPVASPPNDFTPNTMTTTVAAEDIREMTMMDVGPVGERLAVFFRTGDGFVGLRAQSHRDFAKLCETIQRQKTVRPYISLSAIESAALRWLREKYLGKTSQSFLETALPLWEESISTVEIWIPLDRLFLQSDLPLGKVVLRTFQEGFFSALPKLGNADDQKIEQAMQDIRRKLQGRAAAAIVVTADSKRAYEVATEEAEKSLGILRFFSRPMYFPDAPGAATVVGVLDPSVDGHFVLKNGLIASWSHGLTVDGKEPWYVSTKEIAHMEETGLRVLNDMLMNTNPTEFDSSLLSSILLYTRAAITSDVSDRLMYVIASLESFLLRDDHEPLAQNVADRIAYVVGDTPQNRRAIVNNYKAAYSRRSSYVHHGQSVEEFEELRTFFRNVWGFYLNLVLNHKRYSSRKELLEHLEHLKYS